MVNFICSDLCDFAIHIIYPISSVHPIRMKISCHFNHHSHVIAFNVLYTYTRTISIIFSTITEYSSVFWHHGEINYNFGQHFTSLHSVVSPTSPPSTADTEKREKEILLKRYRGWITRNRAFSIFVVCHCIKYFARMKLRYSKGRTKRRERICYPDTYILATYLLGCRH